MKLTFILTEFPLILFFFIGCNDPFQDSSAKNHFKVDGNTIMIRSAAMVNLTGNKVLNEMKGLLFASNGIAFTSKSGKVLQINGKGQLLGFIIHSNASNALTNGDHYIKLRLPFMKGDIAIGFYTMNWDESKGTVFFEKTIGPSLLAGKATVLQKKDIIYITLNFTDEDGNNLTGVYNGKIERNLIYKTDHIDF